MRKPKSANRKIVLGLTGSLATGKSTVAGMLRACGAQAIDADKIAHEIINKRGGNAYQKVAALFGRSILDKKGNIERKKLGRLVFGNAQALKKLNSVLHPEIIRRLKQRVKQSRAKVIVLDAPLLIEAGLANLVDKIIVVKCTLRAQLERAARKGLSRRKSLKIIHSQMPLKKKAALADFIIDNNASREETRKQVRKIRRMLWKN